MSQTAVKILLAVLLAGLLIFGAFQAVSFANRPLDEPLKLNSVPEVSQKPTATAASKAPEVEKAPAADKKTCGNTGTSLILFIGTGVDGDVDNADAVRILKIDYDLKKITIVAIPRDLWVDSGDPDIGEDKLGPVYNTKKVITNGSEKHKDTVATNLIAQILHDTFELSAEKYFTVDILPWGEMVKTIGGVEVDLPEEFVTTDGTIYPAGRHLLNGEHSKDYVRMFVSGGDESRVERQNIFIKGLREKVLTFGIIPKVPDLYKQFDKSIITDLSPKQLADLACMVDVVPQDQVTVYEFIPDLYTVRDDGALLPDVDKIIEFLREKLYLE